MTEKSLIYYTRSSNPAPFLEKLLEIYLKNIPQKILLKPNLVSYEPYPTTTEPELFQAIVRLLKNRTELSAGDAPAADLLRPSASLKNHPIPQIAQEEKIPFFDFYKKEMTRAQTCFGDSLKFSALAKEFDFIISLPVLKSHINVHLTSAIKNQFGFIARKERFRVHFQRKNLLAETIVAINKLVKPKLFVVDFRETLLKANELRHGGKPTKTKGWIFAGEDPLALDWFGFSLLKELEPKLSGKSPEEISYLKLAKEMKLGNEKFELLEL